MSSIKRGYSAALCMILASCLVAGFSASASAGFFSNDRGSKVQRDVDSYEKEGKKWGEDLFEDHINPDSSLDNRTSKDFIEHLIQKDEIDYFGVHQELKEAFKKGFRQGYQDRTADLVLGPHLQEAAGIIGLDTANAFVKVINDFEVGWKKTLDTAVDVFITLIAEGSQADREEFIKNFITIYKEKYQENQRIIKSGASIPFTSEGGTQLYFDPKNVKSTLDIPSDNALKTEIYKQTFRVMGDEMGNRYSHNLISRADLVDWLRRSKSALNMDQGQMENKVIAKSLNIIADAFIKSYGTDGKGVFDGLVKEAGYELGGKK